MPSFKIPANFFAGLSKIHWPRGSPEFFKTRKNIRQYFPGRHLIIHKFLQSKAIDSVDMEEVGLEPKPYLNSTVSRGSQLLMTNKSYHA